MILKIQVGLSQTQRFQSHVCRFDKYYW